MNDNETYEFEDRRYVTPTLSSGEQEQFISNLRDIQAQNNAQIQEQTYNLGTDIPSNLGGLGGGEAYFTSRYQTPQVDEMVSTLKSAAQAQALNDVMTNYKNQLQNRYKQAYRKYQARKRAKEDAALKAATAGNNQTKGKVTTEDTAKKPTSSITTAPIEGHDTSSFAVGSDWVTYDATTGDYYVNGENRGKNPSVVSKKTPEGGGGGSW